MRHVVGKLLKRVTNLLENSSQSEVCKQIYGTPKSQESQLWEFGCVIWDKMSFGCGFREEAHSIL